MNPFPEFVRPESLPFLYLMAFFLVYGAVRLWRVATCARQLRDAVQRLDSADAQGGSPFPDKQKHLNALWSQFESRFDAESVDCDGHKVGVTDPAAVFTQAALIKGQNRQFSRALAGVFAGLGILGTFMGLFFGLQGISAEGQEELLRSVQTLLSGMSTAFLTSLVGIALSLIWLLSDRHAYYRLTRDAALFLHSVRRRFQVRTPESVLLESLSVVQAQKGILQNLGTDIASHLETLMKQPFESIDETLELVANNVDRRQADALEEMVGAFQEKLLGATGTQFDDLANAIGRAAEWQERVNNDVQEVFAQVVELSQSSAELIENSRTAAERFVDSLEGLADSHEKIHEVSRQLHEIVDRTAATSERLGDQVKVFTEANTELRSALGEQLDQVKEQVNQLSEFWGDLRGNLDGLATSLEGSLTEFTSMTQEKLQEIFSRFDSEMGKVVNHLSGTIAEIRDSTEDLAPSISRVEEAMVETLAPIRGAEEKLDDLTRSILAAASLPESLDAARSEAVKLRTVMDELRLAVEGARGSDDGRRPLFGRS